jgi:hypothetical protein
MGGSSGGSQTPVVQTQTKDPWSAAQPFLQTGMQNAFNLYNAGTGYRPYTGQTQAALHPWQSQGLSDMYSIAAQGVPGSIEAANLLAKDMIQNQGMNAGLNTAVGQFGDIYSRALGDQNPYLQGVINAQMDKVNSAMSGAGRYGSGLHQAGIAQAIAPTLAEDYNRRQQLQMQATGAQADIYGQGLQRAGQWAQAAPSLYEAQYLPAQHMQDVGNFYTQYAQQGLNDQMKQYAAQQAWPWEQLARYNAAVQGVGGLGGTTVTQSPGPTQPSSTQRLLGGALAGAGMGSMFGPVGMGVGAIGGGLLGMM